MTRSECSEKLDVVIDAMASVLRPRGFSKDRALFRIARDGQAGLIEVQKSQSNTAELLRFTVNVGVVCGPLQDAGRAKAEKARLVDAHVRQRVGAFLPGHPDKWWEIAPETDIAPLAAEVAQVVGDHALPFIERFLNRAAILELWRSGQSPGLTRVQRERLLARLTSLEAER